ncbi:MAG: ribulokinase [Vagococcus sp.]|uniref:ribulokinase n=1 Tax=Vagococcus sp. TaxID=1933889 RepID=UPI002FCCB6F8
MTNYAIGLDYGTLSVRGVLIEATTGEVLASKTYEYPHGVIEKTLSNTDIKLPDYWCLQHTDDYMNGLKDVVKGLLEQATNQGIKSEDIESLGIGFTCCTVLPVDKDGIPLLKKEHLEKNPHAWVKLWKHHGAQAQADKINHIAKTRNEKWLPYYGGKISSEWLFPKLLQLLEEAPEIYKETAYFIEAGDWLVWQLTGNQKRSKSCAGYKAMYQESLGGYPSNEFFEAVHPNFKNVVEEKIASDMGELGTSAGTVTKEMAEILGLGEKVVVAINNIDAHVCVAATGVTKSNIMLNIIGTSSCDILLTSKNKVIPGIAGLVNQGVVEGLYGYETGQNAVGDIFSWFVETQVPESYVQKAKKEKISIYEYLEKRAENLEPGESGLIALDWWNGNRSTLMNANLTGLVMGMTLQTKPEEMYRALIEATAFGKRMIIENFEKNGIPVDYLVFCGGLPHKNKLLNQIYADVLKKKVAISKELETGAKSAAIFSILANQPNTTLNDVIHQMKLDSYAETYHPRSKDVDTYDQLYAIYSQLVTQFGKNQEMMLSLQSIKKNRRH